MFHNILGGKELTVVEPLDIKYCAFLSYAHNNSRWAQWLHRRLESVRIDRDLVGRHTERGTVPRVVSPVFRDRNDFVGGQVLNDATVDAINGSAAMIVLCSTFAATRPAVDAEVRMFRSHHPDRPVIPVIIDGIYPNNYPPALRYEIDKRGNVTNQIVTILGPDLRKEADGYELGVAKIVAGLTGLETDVVYHRAERARRRRLKLIAAGAAIVLVVVAALGTWAEIQTRRFSNFMWLATDFGAFEVADDTQGWYEPARLATETLKAIQGLASRPPWLAQVKILWFDDKPWASRAAKKAFRKGMEGLGEKIYETNDITTAKAKLQERFDVVIANFGSPQERFAYQLLGELRRIPELAPLVIYGGAVNPAFAREAICYGAVARATELGPLFSAVVRAISSKPTKEEAAAAEERCIGERIKPYDSPAWQSWIANRRQGKEMPRPPRERN